MTDRLGTAVTAVQKQAAAALTEARQALGDLGTALRANQRVAGDVMQPAERLVQGLAGYAELAVDPLARFIDSQRELADQMTTWAELQHQLADRIAAWADVQRQLATAMDLWLSPLSGAAQLTTRVLHDVGGDGAAKTRDDKG